MTPDEAVALSLLPDLPRVGLTARMLAADPELIDLARSALSRVADARRRGRGSGMQVLPWNDSRFPAALLATADCPPALWYRGTFECLEAPAVAIVGSRAASAVSQQLAGELAADLARHGITIVSGLARGVDSAAHRGAISTGCTVAVLGSALDRLYPPEHRPLATEIVDAGGLVCTEYPPGTPALPFHFPLRNRLISGLSRAVVVIEASEKSGSLITAGCALEQGRDVMAVPGNVLSGRNRGGHALIRDGARIVERAEDILEELGLGRRQAGQQESRADLSVTCKDPVVRALEVGQPYDLDALAGLTGLDAPRLLPRLSELELAGILERIDGGRFVRRL